MTHSYHIFYFPFKWEIGAQRDSLFSEQVNLSKIRYVEDSLWERTQVPGNQQEAEALYNEKNYYYEFVHSLLYDENMHTSDLIRHFERKEPKAGGEVYYLIKTKNRATPYRLKVDAMNINLYATGVGFLSFYLKNEDIEQSKETDILAINQFGRRIMPPFYNDIQARTELSSFIRIEGLAYADDYTETFINYSLEDTWQPACFIKNLICDLSENMYITPIIDDRMFVASWYKNNTLADTFCNKADAYSDCTNSFSDFWYRYLFVDGGDATCQNDTMKKELLESHTYSRWQKWCSLYGVSRYSMVYLTNETVPDHLLNSFQTIYARMIELVLVARASMLRFSGEVTKVSYLSNKDVELVSNRISSLYKEYIRFMNQVYFKEVTAQEQGIELYNLLFKSLNMEEYVKDLDEEIEELHKYVSLMEDRERNKKATFLNNIATLFLPVTAICAFWQASGKTDNTSLYVFMVIGALLAICLIYKRRRTL